MAQDITVGIRLKGDAKGLVGEVKLSADSLKALRGEVEQSDRALAKATATVGHYGLAFVSLGATISGLKSYTAVTDTFTQLESKLKLVSTEAWQVGRAQQELLRIAQGSRAPLAEIGDVYTRMARSAAQLGLTQGQVLTVTESVARAMAISGGSADSMRAAMVQLGQGLASGTLRGEELNSIMEQTPRLAQALAEGLGISIGELRKWGEQGKLTTEAVVGALTKVGPKLAEEFSRIAPTVDGSLTVLKNGVGVLISEFDKGTGASKALASELSSLGTSAAALATKAKDVGEFVAPFLKLAAAAVGLTLAAKAIGVVGSAATKLATLGAAVNPGVAAVAGTIGLQGAIMANRSPGVAAQEQEIARLERKLAGMEGGTASTALVRDLTRRQLAQAQAELQQAQARMASSNFDWRSVPALGLDLPSAPEKKMSDAAQAILLKLSGVSEDYVKGVTELTTAYADGVLPLDQYRKAIDKLIESETKYGKDAKQGAENAQKARMVALEAQGKTEAAMMKDRIDRLQFEFEQGLLGEKEYAGRRLQVQLDALAKREQLINQEIALVGKKGKGDPQQVAKLKGDQEGLRMERQSAEREAAQARSVAERNAAAQLLEVRAELMRVRGDEAGAFGAQFDERYAMTRARAGRDGNTALNDEIAALRQVGIERSTLADLTREYERARERLAQVEQSAQSQVIVGLIGEGEARVRVRTESQRAAAELSGSLLPKIKEFTATVKDPLVVAQLEAMVAKIQEMGRVVDESPFAGFAAGAREYLGQVGTDFERMRGIATRAFKGMEDTLVNFVKTGKLDFRSLADSIISDLIRIQIQESYLKPLAKAASGGGGLFGMLSGIFGGGGASLSSNAAAGAASIGGETGALLAAGFLHGGGIAGRDAAFSRALPASTWIGAPRYHRGGLASNEVPAVLLKGEEVLTANDPRHRNNGGGGLSNVRVEIVNESGTRLQVESASPRIDGGELVVGVVLADLSTNGPIAQGLQNRFSLR